MQEIRDLIRPENVFLNLPGRDKFDVIHRIIIQMSGLLSRDDLIVFEAEVVGREKEIPTGLLQGAALPHARSRVVKDIVIAFARLRYGVDFGASDDEPARLIFLFGIPNDQINDYLKLVARLCRVLQKKSFRTELLQAKNRQEIIEILSRM